MKKIVIYSTVVFSFLLTSAGITVAQRPLSEPLSVEKARTVPSKSTVNPAIPLKKPNKVKDRLPDLTISRLSLDNKGRVQGYFENKGGLVNASDFNKIDIRVSYRCDQESKSITLTASPAVKTRHPKLLKQFADKQSFNRGRAVYFLSDLIVPPGCNAKVTAQIDPENKIKETIRGERNNTARAHLKSKNAIVPKSRVPIRTTVENVDRDVLTRTTVPFPGGEFIVEFPKNTRRNRKNPIDIIWSIPNRYESLSGQPTARFRVELLREDGSVASQISTRNAVYNSEENRYTLPWLVPAQIPNGRYQIKITLYPLNPQGEGGNLTAYSHQGRDFFTIFPRKMKASHALILSMLQQAVTVTLQVSG